MASKPLISVVVPAYNVEPYLARCLDSILDQTYSPIEIIIVDDGATDHSGIIANEYARKFSGRIKSIQTKNYGVTSARMNGIKNASGEWIGFVDGDDQIEPDMYQRLIVNAQKYHAEISHCGYRTVVNDGETIHWFYNTGRLVEQDRITGLRDLLSGSFVEPGLWNKLFHRSLFHSLLHSDVMDKSIRLNEDLLMNYYLFSEAKRSVYEDFCPYIYMARATSVTRSGDDVAKLFDTVKVRKAILNSVDSELKDLAWNKLLVSCCGVCSAIYKNSKYKQEAKELKRFLIENRGRWRNLQRKEKLKLYTILYMPSAYSSAYKLYEKYFQRKIYE